MPPKRTACPHRCPHGAGSGRGVRPVGPRPRSCRDRSPWRAAALGGSREDRSAGRGVSSRRMAAAAEAEILDRDAELARLGGFVDGSRDLPAFVLVEGEAGIGKSTLWRWTVGRARGRGYRVLVCRLNGNEVSIAYAAL